MNLAVFQGRAAFRLDGDVLSVGQSVDQGIDAAVGQWQEYVKRASRLLCQLGPQAELEDLA